jgi:protease PrsW
MEQLAGCIAIALASGAGWFTIILRLDPHRREKNSTRSLAMSLLIGLASIPLVLLLYVFVPDLVSGMRSERLRELVWEVLAVGPIEEFGKFFIFFLIVLKRKPVQEPLDAMLHAAAVALAFSLVENVKYGLQYGYDTTLVRAFLSTPGHMMFAGIWGFAYAVFIHGNPRRRARDYVVLFLSLYPAALVHGLSNFMLVQLGDLALLFDAGLLVAAVCVLAWLRRVSPFRSFSIGEAAAAARRIDLSLASNGASFPLHLRAAQVRTALGEFSRARHHIDRCMQLRKGDAFAVALSGMIRILLGETDRGEELLGFAYGSLGAEQKLTLQRLSRHLSRSEKTSNAFNEFLLSMSVRDHAAAARKRAPAPRPRRAGPEKKT